MKHRFVVAMLLLLVSPFSNAHQTTAREKQFDMLKFSLHLNFDLPLKQVKGRAIVEFAPLTPINFIKLDATSLDIEKITDENGQSLNFGYNHAAKDESLLIRFNKNIPESTKTTVIIYYSTNAENLSDPLNTWGSFGKGIRYLKPTSSEPRRRWQAWTVGLPGSNRCWFPGYDAFGDAFDFEIWMEVEKGLTGISNGILLDTKTNETGRKVFHWKAEHPLFNHQIAIVIGEYKELISRQSGVDIYTYSYPDELDATLASTVRLADMLVYFSNYTGHSFPYSRYSQVFVQDLPWGGAHHASFSTITENLVDDAGTHADFLYLWDLVEANDLAAQWFGQLITPYSAEHAWLNKSFANYFSGMYDEFRNGEDEFQLWVRNFNISTILNDWNNAVRRPLVLTDSIDEKSLLTDNYAISYGAEVLHQLRKQIGEDKWKNLVKRYVAKYSGQMVTTEDFYYTVEEVTGKNMRWFFNQWIYSMGHPVFEVNKQYDPGRQELKLVLKQTQQIDSASKYPQTSLFQGWMEIEIDETVHKIWIPASKESEFVLRVAAKPTFVNVDYKRQWIKEINYLQSSDELTAQLLKSTDILARNEAIQALSTLYQKDSTVDKQMILSILAKISTGNSYWRLRMAAINAWRSLVGGKINSKTIETLKSIIQRDSSWVRSSAIAFLGDSKDKNLFPLYKKYLADRSDRVINTAAIAIGKSAHPEAFKVLANLPRHPSWKNQSLISSLNGLFQLGDPRGVQIALDALQDDPPQPRWTLANTTWDYRFTAVSTLVKLKDTTKAFEILEKRLGASINEHSMLDIFNNLQLLTMLGDQRLVPYFDQLKNLFQKNNNAMEAILQLENGFKSNK